MARARSKPQGTVAARHAAEAEREETARAMRAELVDETRKAQRATARRLENKPTDTRTIAP